jgi:CRP/FNR family transcriptional regulator, putaive post-exponential-phase nitrogen-starvation regulator
MLLFNKRNRYDGEENMREITSEKQLMEYINTYKLESVFKKELLPHLSLYDVEAGERLCSQGDASHCLYILMKGKVKVYTISPEGKTLVLSFKQPLEVIGDIEYVQDVDIMNTVEAVSPLVVIGIPYKRLKQYASKDPQLLTFLLEMLTKKFCAKSNSLSFNLMYPVEVRLASYLLSIFCEESHLVMNQKTESLKDIANLIGTTYRHLNRVLQKFVAQGVIEKKKGSIILKDKEKLSCLANDNIYE